MTYSQSSQGNNPAGMLESLAYLYVGCCGRCCLQLVDFIQEVCVQRPRAIAQHVHLNESKNASRAYAHAASTQ